MVKPSEDVAPTNVARAEAIAAGLSIAWLFAVGFFFWMLPPTQEPGTPFDSLRFMLMLLAVFLPVAMIWVVVVAARSARLVKAETMLLKEALENMRQAYLIEQAKTAAEPSADAKVTPIRPSIAAVPVPPKDNDKPRIVSRVIIPEPAPQPPDQQSLPLGAETGPKQEPLDRADLVRGLNFPDNEHDSEGFAALRRVLRDRSARHLVQASQDILTLLSQDGIYMDDLQPDPTIAAIWRRFAAGERGPAIASLGAVRHPEALDKTVKRMREDTIFRDTAHHFLRKYDQMLVRYEREAADSDLLALAATRTSLAFMLLGRATGTFE